MSADELQRVTAFRSAFARRQAVETVEVPGGAVLRDPRFPLSHEHNQLLVDGAGDPASLAGLAEQGLGDLRYRRISVLDEALGAACAPVLLAAGYQQGTELVLIRSTTGCPLPEHPAQDVDLADVLSPLLAQLRRWMPAPEQAETARQLAGRREARLRGADRVRFLAARDEQGAVASWADLYLSPDDGLAQIEDLVTADTHTRQGHAGTVLATALARAAEAGCGQAFLLAAEDDWPRHWYLRRGFTLLGRSHVFTRRA